MKKIIVGLLLLGILQNAKAQNQGTSDDLSKITLNTYVSEKAALTGDAKNLLEDKLRQIVSVNGLGDNSSNARFIITAAVNIGTKDIVAGPPQMIAQNVEVSLFIGDALDDKIFSTVLLSLKGVGTNENKSFIEAIKSINPKKKEIVSFIEAGKNKIIAYYNTQCELIINDAMSLAQKEKYDEAIYKLSLVPIACTSCYSKCSQKIHEIYEASINQDGKHKLSEANAVWASASNLSGAEKAIALLSKIHLDASCKKDADKLIEQISSKLQADEKKDWELKLKQYEDAQKMEQQRMRMTEESDVRNSQLESERLNAAKQVALEYAKNQPKITYNNIYWR
jgi:predicted transposase YbfD/YdcC